MADNFCRCYFYSFMYLWIRKLKRLILIHQLPNISIDLEEFWRAGSMEETICIASHFADDCVGHMLFQCEEMPFSWGFLLSKIYPQSRFHVTLVFLREYDLSEIFLVLSLPGSSTGSVRFYFYVFSAFFLFFTVGFFLYSLFSCSTVS